MENRNGVLTFIFSLMPGAGEMYLGMMKRGTFLMSLFFGISFLAAFLRTQEVAIILPIIWCYSFFDTMNMSRTSSEYRESVEDDFSYNFKRYMGKGLPAFESKQKAIIGWIMVILGIYIVFQNVINPSIYRILDYFNIEGYIFYDIMRAIPNIIVAMLLIMFGFKVLNNKDSEPKEEFVEYLGKEFDKTESEEKDK